MCFFAPGTTPRALMPAGPATQWGAMVPPLASSVIAVPANLWLTSTNDALPDVTWVWMLLPWAVSIVRSAFTIAMQKTNHRGRGGHSPAAGRVHTWSARKATGRWWYYYIIII